eukprot:scaffold20716_cov69-Cylindrotheca_fusiformis.AAC.1
MIRQTISIAIGNFKAITGRRKGSPRCRPTLSSIVAIISTFLQGHFAIPTTFQTQLCTIAIVIFRVIG